MQKDMKLRCLVERQDNTGRYQCTAKLFDGTEFTVRCFEYEVLVQGEFSENQNQVDGWILVRQEAQQDERVSIKLPQPSDQHGRQVVVSQYSLMPRHVTLEDFGKQ